MWKGGPVSDDFGNVDFLLGAYREEGEWQVEPLPLHLLADLDALMTVLRQRPGDAGALALASVDEDFFVAVRTAGTEVRLLLSDVTAATEWPLAREILGRLGLPLPDEDDRVQPAGDLAIFSDLGIDAMEMAAICDDIDSYPDEMLADIAARLGFEAQFEGTLDTVRGG